MGAAMKPRERPSGSAQAAAKRQALARLARFLRRAGLRPHLIRACLWRAAVHPGAQLGTGLQLEIARDILHRQRIVAP